MNSYSKILLTIKKGNLKKEEKFINTKGRKFKIDNYEGVTRFSFKELCDENLGAEDYLN